MQGKKKAICTTGFIIVNIGIFLGIMLIGKDGDTMFLLEFRGCHRKNTFYFDLYVQWDRRKSAFTFSE